MKIDINIKTNNNIEDQTGEHELNITTVSAIEKVATAIPLALDGWLR